MAKVYIIVAYSWDDAEIESAWRSETQVLNYIEANKLDKAKGANYTLEVWEGSQCVSLTLLTEIKRCGLCSVWCTEDGWTHAEDATRHLCMTCYEDTVKAQWSQKESE